MDYSWITTTWTAIIMVIISSIGIYIAIILFTRLSGLRSFSKMSSFDFAMTVAVGSLFASTILAKDPPLIQSVIALGALFGLQIIVAKLRGISPLMSKIVDNQPTLLMKGSQMLEENLKSTKVTTDDVRAKLREANVTDLNQVKAVILETTGDISVLHSTDTSQKLDDFLLTDVKGWNV
ncbi:DUF421 domain-containing protein [Rhodohalobacter sp. SW132]|uniref:DUF421 domain-containing protein n=1 Tax=Rhodohalobacter sp. SW132 TaxID=2293433 RepID=UPI000E277690|nr:YetF domain-containing protein [Rhodohalobacter sp. SW132]REL32941.1 DUF421 domain-containing protein [Rhodohalobacter sp. SW132]